MLLLFRLVLLRGINRACSLRGAEMRCRDNAEQGAHLRQPCLPSEPRDPARCPVVHCKVSPMMNGPSSPQPGE